MDFGQPSLRIDSGGESAKLVRAFFNQRPDPDVTVYVNGPERGTHPTWVTKIQYKRVVFTDLDTVYGGNSEELQLSFDFESIQYVTRTFDPKGKVSREVVADWDRRSQSS
jgi:hypothetical protein